MNGTVADVMIFTLVLVIGFLTILALIRTEFETRKKQKQAIYQQQRIAKVAEFEMREKQKQTIYQQCIAKIPYTSQQYKNLLALNNQFHFHSIPNSKLSDCTIKFEVKTRRKFDQFDFDKNFDEYLWKNLEIYH